MPAEELLTIASHEKLLIQSLVVILCTSTIVALLLQRLRVALIPAYIVAGIVIGPSALSLVKSTGVLEEIGHLAVVLLLFGVGMELHLSALRSQAIVLFGTALVSCFLCTAVGIPTILSFGFDLASSLVIALALSLSSTALVLRLLTSSRELVRGHGQLSLAILVSQDLLVLFMLAAIPSIATYAQGASAANIGAAHEAGVLTTKALSTALALIVVFVAGQKLLPRLLTESIRNRSTEVLLLAALSAALLGAFVTKQLGLSLEMGAFLVGFLLASSPFRYQLAGQVTPLRDACMAIFFTVLGMQLELSIVLSHLDVILIATVLLLFLKSICMFIAAWLFGVHNRIAILSALILAQAGEFSLIVLNKASHFNILTPDEISIVIGVVVLSLGLTPALFSLSKRLAHLSDKLPSAPWIPAPSLEQSEERLLSASGEHVVVAGYGPVGREICRSLRHCGIPFTVVELNAATVNQERQSGLNIVFGDISNEGILRAVDVQRARALVITFPDPRIAMSAAGQARLLNQELEIVARASSIRDKVRLEAAEVNEAVIDEEACAREMIIFAHRYGRGTEADQEA